MKELPKYAFLESEEIEGRKIICLEPPYFVANVRTFKRDDEYISGFLEDMAQERYPIAKVKGYTIMPNYHQRDRTLSIKAKGILSQMFSLPEGWDYTLRGLAYLNTDGIDSMRSGIRPPRK